MLMSEYIEQAIKILKENEFRITNPRKLVIKLLDKSKEALSAYEIKDKLDSQGKDVDIASIYRIIECLEQNKLVHRVLSTSKIMKCQLKHEDECDKHHEHHHCHHLLICQKCGSIEEIHCAGINPIIKTVESHSKFKVKKHSLEFYGICSRCN